MDKESGILKVATEDILRLLAEEKKKVSTAFINGKTIVSPAFIAKVINKLREDGMVCTDGNSIWLTPEGEVKSKNILEKHLLLEKYFEDFKNKKEAHEISHIFEHYISKEVLDNLKKLSTFKGEGLSLADFKGNEGSITDIVLDTKQFERIISLGVFPGEKIKIIARLPNGVALKMENKKLFLSWGIAKGIKVMEYAKA